MPPPSSGAPRRRCVWRAAIRWISRAICSRTSRARWACRWIARRWTASPSPTAARARFEQGILRLDTLRLAGPAGTLDGSGSLGLTRSAGNDSLVIALDVDSLGGLRRYLGTTVASAGGESTTSADTLLGTVRVTSVLRGWLDSLDIRGSIDGRELRARANGARTVRGSIALQQVRGHTTGSIAFAADTAFVGGLRVNRASVQARMLDKGRARFGATANAFNGTGIRAGGDFTQVGDSVDVRLDTLTLAIGDSSRWGLLLPAHLTKTPAALSLDTLLLASGIARLAGSAFVPATAPVRAHLRADSVPLADLGRLAQLASPLSGRVGLDIDVSGTKQAPLMTLSGAAHALKVGGFTAESMRISGRYADARAAMDATLVRGGRSILDASVSYPIALTLFGATATGDTLGGRIRADSVDLALIEALSPKLRNATGRMTLDLAVSGKPERPHFGGLASIRNGTIEIPGVGIRFSGMEMRLAVDPLRDSLTIERLGWISPANGGSASVRGSVVFRDIHNPQLDLRLDARGLRAVDKRDLARLDISTGPSGLTLTGTEEQARMSGAVNVDRGTIFIPELVNKRLVDFTQEEFAELFDTTDVRNRSLMPQPPGRLVEHLRLDGVSVNIGDEVWLRSAEANIKLGGSLNVTRARGETTRSNLGRALRGDSALYRLALSGALSADRGTYTLDLGVVQREFQVQTGRITFFGTPDFNPQIDVSALYRVKQARRADIAVKARIVGPFYPQPSLELSSDDAFISQTDLVSYLVTGRPSFELNESGAAASQRAAEVLLPTGGALLSRALREQLGGFVDLIQIQTGAVDDRGTGTANAVSDQFKSVLSGTRLGGEKQISNRLFLSFSTGLCQLSGSDKDQPGVTGFVNSIEGKLEYRFPMIAPDQLSLRAGREPAASALRCGSTGNIRGFVATPQQWGLSLFRSWSF
jgi:translocation and assembly module TamB